MHTAVLVIDVQQGLCEGPDAAYDCPGTIERINAVTQRARDASVPVFFFNTSQALAIWSMAAVSGNWRQACK